MSWIAAQERPRFSEQTQSGPRPRGSGRQALGGPCKRTTHQRQGSKVLVRLGPGCVMSGISLEPSRRTGPRIVPSGQPIRNPPLCARRGMHAVSKSRAARPVGRASAIVLHHHELAPPPQTHSVSRWPQLITGIHGVARRVARRGTRVPRLCRRPSRSLDGSHSAHPSRSPCRLPLAKSR